jgi:hypothetical protein
MKEASVVGMLIYWMRRLFSSGGKAHTVHSWQIIAYLIELERKNESNNVRRLQTTT